MVIFTKYSNERDPGFCIQTEIRQEESGERCVYKLPSFPEAAAHTGSIFRKYQWLSRDLSGSGLTVNPCEPVDGGAVRFPFVEGAALEEELDELLEKGKLIELLSRIQSYFERFSGKTAVFEMTEAFRQVFGTVSFEREQKCRSISDIDMIFSNAIRTEDGYELIDYEWTFDFPVPLRFLQYRCLYYYVLGSTKRDVLTQSGTFLKGSMSKTDGACPADIFQLFDITPQEREQFARMERHFQAYMLGAYTPIWRLYDDISDGVIPVLPLVEQHGSAQRAMRTAEVYFDDGRGYGIWSFHRYQTAAEGVSTLRIVLPDGTKAVRIDPCAMKSVVRILHLRQNGSELTFSCNGERTPGGDLLFDTEDPQIWISELPHGTEPIELVFSAEPMTGLVREALLSQNGRLRWMEQTKVWRAYRKLKKE